MERGQFTLIEHTKTGGVSTSDVLGELLGTLFHFDYIELEDSWSDFVSGELGLGILIELVFGTLWRGV